MQSKGSDSAALVVCYGTLEPNSGGPSNGSFAACTGVSRTGMQFPGCSRNFHKPYKYLVAWLAPCGLVQGKG